MPGWEAIISISHVDPPLGVAKRKMSFLSPELWIFDIDLSQKPNVSFDTGIGTLKVFNNNTVYIFWNECQASNQD
jgi:hypothetical protein